MTKHKDLKGITFNMPYFKEFNIPRGFLNKHPSCHGLFYYASLVRMQLFDRDERPREEKEEDPLQNPQQLFTSIATAYGCSPEHMAKWWHNVDMQYRLMAGKREVKLIPQEYRFDKVYEIKGH